MSEARLFVALWPPTDMVHELARIERLKHRGLRWTAAARLHVTLRFLGLCDEEEALNTLEAMMSEHKFAPLRVTVGPSVTRLGRNVLVLPVSGVDHIAVAVISGTRQLGTPPRGTGFRGHLTVARRGRGSMPKCKFDFHASFVANEIALVRSHPPGTYTNFATLTLR